MSEEISAEPPQLSPQDISNALDVIDYACDQGAFKSWKVITDVFAVRTKLAEFVDWVKAQHAAAPNPNTETE